MSYVGPVYLVIFLLRRTSSILRTFLGGTSKKKTPCIITQRIPVLSMLHQHASHVARQRPRKSSGRRPTNIGCTRTAALPVLATILHNTVLYVMSHVGKNNHTDTMPYITNIVGPIIPQYMWDDPSEHFLTRCLGSFMGSPAKPNDWI